MKYADFDKLNIGDTVYFQEIWTGFITEGKIAEKHLDEKTQLPHCIIKCHLGEIKCGINAIYTSREECRQALSSRHTRNIDTYKNEITDITSLLNFAVNHVLADAESYTDYEARQAFIEKAKELCDVDIKIN